MYGMYTCAVLESVSVSGMDGHSFHIVVIVSNDYIVSKLLLYYH